MPWKLNTSVLLKELKSCTSSRNLRLGEHIYAFLVRNGDDSNTQVTNTLISMFGKCNRMDKAIELFGSMNITTVVTWTALISGYVENGYYQVALELFTRMKREGCEPNSRTMIAAIKACIYLFEKQIDVKAESEALHVLALRMKCGSDLYVMSTLVYMYAKIGDINQASRLFDSMEYRDVVLWTTLIWGYVDNGASDAALELFSRMRDEGFVANSLTFVATIKACIGSLEKLRSLHLLTSRTGIDSDICVRSSLVDVYAKLRDMNFARIVFESIERPNVVCWTALILGYAENGKGETALHLFSKMRTEGYVPDETLYIAALKVCGMIGALETGRKIHAELFNVSVALGNALVDLYAKCGSLDEAKQMFLSHISLGVIAWTSLMAGYSRHGSPEDVFMLFNKMLDTGIKPNAITFLTVLGACNHGGLVEKGKSYFEAMERYGIDPNLEHYTCMIDVLARANQLDNAMVFLRSMSCSPNATTWMTVMGACRTRNVHLGRLAFESLMSLEDRNAGAYVLMT